MIDLGKKYGMAMAGEVDAEMEEKVSYPSLYLNDMDYDDETEVGEEVYAKVKLCKTMTRKDRSGYTCEYDIKAIEFKKEESDDDSPEGEMREAIKEVVRKLKG